MGGTAGNEATLALAYPFSMIEDLHTRIVFFVGLAESANFKRSRRLTPTKDAYQRTI